MSFIGIIISILILGILVVVHEFGHYIVARKNGIFVKEFSIGFGPRIISHECKSGMLFSWKAIPFGGSCQMLGALEDEDDDTDNEQSYDKKSVWARISVTIAGPVFNFLLAFILAVIVIGTVGYDPAVVLSVVEDSPVYEAGLRAGDKIVSYNGASINFGKEIYLQNYVDPITEDSQVSITYERDGQKNSITVKPAQYDYYSVGISYYSNEAEAEIAEVSEGSPCDEAGIRAGDVITSINGTEINSGQELEQFFSEYEITSDPIEVKFTRHGGEYETLVQPVLKSAYRLGFTYNTASVKAGVLETLKYSFAEIGYEIKSIFMSLGILFSDQGSLDMLSGPVGIVEVVGTTYDISAASGFLTTLMNMLSIMIMLSANLGLLNLFPIPALDGGRLLLLLIEAISRRRLAKKTEGIITVIGASLLMILMLVVMVNDVTKFF